MDQTDLAMLLLLQNEGRLSVVDLAKRIHLSPPATHARLRRLEAEQTIRYAAIVDRQRVGFDLLCFVHVSLQTHQPEQVERIRRLLSQMPEILECHHITGKHDYLLKVAVRNRAELEQFLVQRLTPVPGIGRLETSLALSEVKATTALPLD